LREDAERFMRERLVFSDFQGMASANRFFAQHGFRPSPE
jgi:hypothetical protein